MMTSKFLPGFFLLLSTGAWGADTARIAMNPSDLEAAMGLLRFSQTKVRFDGVAGSVTPSLGFQGMGFAPVEFELAHNPIVVVLGSMMKDLNSKQVALSIGKNGLRVTMKFEEDGAEIATPWGDIDLAEIEGTFELFPQPGASGGLSSWVPVNETFYAEVVQNPTRVPNYQVKLGVKTFGAAMISHGARAFLGSPSTQVGLRKLLLLWASIWTGREWSDVEFQSLSVADGSLSYVVSE
jgi:hypothetical protein